MTIKQISVFLENKSGRINDVTKALGKAGITCMRSAWPKRLTLVSCG